MSASTPTMQTRFEDGIVAGLEAAEIAALAGEQVIAAEQIERAGEIGGPAGLRRREVGPRRCKADMAADIEAGPVIGRRGRGHAHRKVGGTGAAGGEQRGRGNARTHADRRARRIRPCAAPAPRREETLATWVSVSSGGMHAHGQIHLFPFTSPYRPGHPAGARRSARSLPWVSLDPDVRLPARSRNRRLEAQSADDLFDIGIDPV